MTDLVAFESATERLKAMVPEQWTVLDMGELGRRMLTEIKATDLLYTVLVDRRCTVINLKRDALKGELKQKHAKGMQHQKLARPWIENGANKRIMLVLLEIGACWVIVLFCRCV